MTIADSVADEHYGTDRKTLAMKFAAILNAEARELSAAGADVVQFDEPCFNIYLDEVEAWLVVPDQRIFAWVNGMEPVPPNFDTGLFRRLQSFHNKGPA